MTDPSYASAFPVLSRPAAHITSSIRLTLYDTGNSFSGVTFFWKGMDRSVSVVPIRLGQ